jgi:hypothetical protein
MATMYKINVNSTGAINLWKQDEIVWRDAIELEPKPIVRTNQIAVPQYNLLSNPVEITYLILDLLLEERKGSEISNAKQQCMIQVSSITQRWIHSDEPVNLPQIEQAKADLTTKIAAISAATTHEELDAVLGL